MLDLLLSEYDKNGGAITVVTDRAEVQQLLREYGVVSFLLRHQPTSISERDQQFKEDLLPGILGEDTFPKTDLPLWKVLSLDRFKFWYNPGHAQWMEFIDSFGYHTAYISLDIGSTLPWIAFANADSWATEIIAVKTEPIRTAEMGDFVRNIFNVSFIVDSQEDEKFLKQSGANIVTVIPAKAKAAAESPTKEESRKAFGMPLDGLIYGVLFDKRDEHSCRRWLAQNVGKTIILVFPADSRSSDLAPSVLYRYMDEVSVMNNYDAMHACDSVVAFRFDEQYPNVDLIEVTG